MRRNCSAKHRKVSRLAGTLDEVADGGDLQAAHRAVRVPIKKRMGAGAWGAGGDSPVNFCAWARAELNWLTPSHLTGGPQPISLSAAAGEVLRVDARTTTKEYFLIESRAKVGLDTELPGEGLLVWHVDESRRDNSHPPIYRVALEQADGQEALQNGDDRGDAGDPFPGATSNTTFGENTDPNSQTNRKPQPSGVEISNISWQAGTSSALLTAP